MKHASTLSRLIESVTEAPLVWLSVMASVTLLFASIVLLLSALMDPATPAELLGPFRWEGGKG